MAFSHRQFIKNMNGRVAFNLNIGAVEVTRRSVVLVTAAPCSLGDGFLDPDIRLDVHGPDVRVSNVVPHGPEGATGGVEYVLTADAPTDVAVTITILEPWESFGSQ